MKKYVYLAAAAFVCASCFSVNVNFKGAKGMINGTGPVETRTLDLKDFKAVCVKGNAGLRLSQADSFMVSVTTQENVFDSLDYAVEDSVLVIRALGGRRVRADEYRIDLSMPDLASMEINGAVDFKALTPLTLSGDLDVSVNGAGELSFGGLTCRHLSFMVNGASEVEAPGLDVASISAKINGAGEVKVSGKAGEADLEVNGAGDIDARELTVAGEVRKKAAGAARIRL